MKKATPSTIRRELSPAAMQITFADGPASFAQHFIQDLVNSSVLLSEDWENLPDQARKNLLKCCTKDNLLESMVRQGLLTAYQAERIDAGTTHGLILGNYRVLDRLGAGGAGTVF